MAFNRYQPLNDRGVSAGRRVAPKTLTRGIGSNAKRATELLFSIPNSLMIKEIHQTKSNSNALLPWLRPAIHRQNPDGILELQLTSDAG
jgi:hypothetical protein